MTRVQILRHKTKELSQRTMTQLNAVGRTDRTTNKSSRVEEEGPWGKQARHDGRSQVVTQLQFATKAVMKAATMSQTEGAAE
jgi:hypothetical protein